MRNLSKRLFIIALIFVFFVSCVNSALANIGFSVSQQMTATDNHENLFYANANGSSYGSLMKLQFNGAGTDKFVIDRSGNVTAAGYVSSTKICLNSVCNTIWPSGGSSQWTTSGSNIYYNTGNVGIGTNNPVNALQVESSLSGVWAGYLRNTNSNGAGLYVYTGNNSTQQAFQVGSAAQASIIYARSDGNVGIGTNNPVQKLDVAGAIQSISGTGGKIYFNGNDVLSSVGGGYLNINSSIGYSAVIISGNVGIGVANPGYKLEVGGAIKTSGDAILQNVYADTVNSIIAGDPLQINYRSTSPTIICATANCASESAYFGVNGNVGIGNSSPTGLLQLGAGNFSATNGSYKEFHAGGFGVLFRNEYDAYISGNTQYSASGWINKYSGSKSNIISMADGNIEFDIGSGTIAGSDSDPAAAMYIRNDGNVGIGITSPNGKLDVESSSGNGVYVSNSGTALTDYGITSNVGGTATAIAGNAQGGNGVVGNANGYGGIGVMATNNSSTGVNSYGYPAAAIVGVNSGGGYGIYGWTQGGGYAIYGYAQSGGYSGYFNGQGYISTSAWNYGSDRRLKENIKYFDDSKVNALDLIAKLRPASFDYIDGQKNTEGFIAQDVQEVIPNLVSTQPNGMLGVQTTNLIPYMIKGTQEQQAEINALQKDNQELRGEVEALKKAVANLQK